MSYYKYFNKLFIITVFVISNAYSQSWFVTDENWREVLYEKYAPSVVIVSRMNNNEVTGFGSGFNIDKNGLIVTNYHVIQEGDGVIVKFKNGDSFEALHYTFVDKDKDFVILEIAGYDLPYSNFGNSDDIKIGQEVVAIGNPEGEFHTMTSGIISQKKQVGSHQLFVTDVTIAPGSSGGPLFNSDNQVIGITSSGLGLGLDINYAIPSKYVQGAINSSSSNTKKLIGFDRDKRLDEYISIVKKQGYYNVSINDAIKDNNPRWEAFIMDGYGFVNLDFNLKRGDKPVDVVWQFKIYGDNKVKHNAIEIDGVQQGIDMKNQIIELLFKDDSNQNKSPDDSSTSKTTTAQVSKTSSEEPGLLFQFLSCYCTYLLFLGLLPRG